jgi:hypothetical protein
MEQALLLIALVLLVAFMAFKVRNGTWYGTWCASGKPDRGPQFPAGPHLHRRS